MTKIKTLDGEVGTATCSDVSATEAAPAKDPAREAAEKMVEIASACNGLRMMCVAGVLVGARQTAAACEIDRERLIFALADYLRAAEKDQRDKFKAEAVKWLRGIGWSNTANGFKESF